jgi:bacterial/archaeal transporter family protein
MTANMTVIIYAGFTILMWGLWGFFGKMALERNMPPVSVFLAEVLISLFVAAFFVRRAFIPPQAKWSMFGLFSGAGLAIGLVFYYLALEHAQANMIVPLTSLYPAVTVVLSYIFLHERLSPLQWVGLVLLLVGAYLLLSSGRSG